MPGSIFLRGDQIDLQVIEEEDLPFLQRVINTPAVWATLHHVDPVTMQDEQAYYEDVIHADHQTQLLICDDTGAVGVIGLSKIDPTWGIAELGYYVDPEAQGRGYATEAADLMTSYAFDHRRLDRLYAYVIADNPASRRVLEKNGFEEEGRLREHAYIDGIRKDVLVYGLLQSDHED